MEFPFDLSACLGATFHGGRPCVGLVDENVLHGGAAKDLCTVLDIMGKKSAVAQGLRKPVTTGSKQELVGQRVYLIASGTTALGLLKVGPKRLFVAPPVDAKSWSSGVQDAFREINPLCTLDFYVHETCQRTGYGRCLFDAMLSRERVSPGQLAYDRPSPKLLAFLAKHFKLTQFRPQGNNFVVFDDYFRTPSAGTHSGSISNKPPLRSPKLPNQEMNIASRPLSLPSRGDELVVDTSSNTPAGTSCRQSACIPPFGTDQAGIETYAERASNNADATTMQPALMRAGYGPCAVAAGRPTKSSSCARSASLPSRGQMNQHASASVGSLFGEQYGTRAFCHIGKHVGSSATTRFASPLSHIGERLLLG